MNKLWEEIAGDLIHVSEESCDDVYFDDESNDDDDNCCALQCL